MGDEADAAMDDALCAEIDNGIWVGQDGKHWYYNQLEDGHLRNIIKYLDRESSLLRGRFPQALSPDEASKLEWFEDKLYELRKEAQRRIKTVELDRWINSSGGD